MIRINLLPIRQIKRRARLRRQVVLLLVTLLLLIGCLFSIRLWQSATISDRKGDIARLTSQRDSFTPLIQEIAQLKKAKKELDAKINAIKSLKQHSGVAVHILDELASRTPENRMWLVALKQSNNTLSLQGVALDNATIAQYMEEMNRSPYFVNAELVSSSLLDVSGQKLKSFNMTLTIAHPKAAETANSAG